MIPGLELINDAASEEYAAQIVALLPAVLTHGAVEPPTEVQIGAAHAGQAVGSGLQAHYFRPLPDFVSFVDEDVIPDAWRQRVWHDEEGAACDCAIVQRYDPGQGIRPHVDLDRFRDGVAILSLLSGCVMDLYADSADQATERIYLPPRSLLLMRGDARYKWRHGIQATMTDLMDKHVTNWRALPEALASRVARDEAVEVARQRRISITMRRVTPELHVPGP